MPVSYTHLDVYKRQIIHHTFGYNSSSGQDSVFYLCSEHRFDTYIHTVLQAFDFNG